MSSSVYFIIVIVIVAVGMMLFGSVLFWDIASIKYPMKTPYSNARLIIRHFVRSEKERDMVGAFF